MHHKFLMGMLLWAAVAGCKSRVAASCPPCAPGQACAPNGQCLYLCATEADCPVCTSCHATDGFCYAEPGCDSACQSQQDCALQECESAPICECIATAETDEELCLQAEAECGALSTTDQCDDFRAIESCGTCPAHHTCTGNQCTCVPSDQVCLDPAQYCGVEVEPHCGVEVSCGECIGTSCGDDGRCIPICQGLSIVSSQLDSETSIDGTHDVFVGAAVDIPDGETTPAALTLLIMRPSSGCIGSVTEANRSLTLYDRDLHIEDCDAACGNPCSNDFCVTPVNAAFRDQVHWHESKMALLPDALTVLAMTNDRRELVFARRSGLMTGDFSVLDDQSALAAVNALLVNTDGVFDSPVYTPHGLSLFVRVQNDAAVNGHYEAQRTHLDAPFGTPRRLEGVIDQFQRINGVSHDGLTVFMYNPWDTWVLHRPHMSADFDGPEPTQDNKFSAGWRLMPLLPNCLLLVGTGNAASGCTNEGVYIYQLAPPEPD